MWCMCMPAVKWNSGNKGLCVVYVYACCEAGTRVCVWCMCMPAVKWNSGNKGLRLCVVYVYACCEVEQWEQGSVCGVHVYVSIAYLCMVWVIENDMEWAYGVLWVTCISF